MAVRTLPPSPTVGAPRRRRWVEPMESRQLLSGVAATVAVPLRTAHAGSSIVARTTLAGTAAKPYLAQPVAVIAGGPWSSPLATPFAAGAATAPFTPAQVRHLYGVDAVSFNGTAGDGTGQTIAVIDAYSSPTITTDIATFDSTFGLPTCNLTVENQYGQTDPSDLPRSDSGWAGEISLDVEWAHAIAPAAKILLVECNSAGGDLFTGAAVAANTAGVSAVSMSFGGGEGSSTADSTFAHAGVTFLASTGDSGGDVEYPATSPDVVAVGGTSVVTADASADYGSESAWSDGGGGTSAVEAAPAYQSAVNAGTHRTVPDVSMLADPNTGVYLYENGSYYLAGGTSLSSPMWAGLIAIANQGRAQQGLSSLTGYSQTLPRLYQLAATDFHDVTAGSNGHAATAGYDLATGLGTPIANKLVPDLAGDASVTGRVYVDHNANGSFDAADTAALAGQSVYLDLNDNGTRDATEPTATLASNGTYTFADLVSGGDLLGGLGGTVRLSAGTPAGYVAVGTGNTFTTAYATAGATNIGLFPIAYADAKAADAWTVRASPTAATTVQILLNGTVADSAPASLLASSPLSFSFTGSGDGLTVDYGNGDPVPSGSMSFTAAAASNNDALSILGTSSSDAITVNAAAVVFGSDTITYAKVANLSVDPRGGTDALTINSGTVTVPAQTAGGGVLARTFSKLSVANGAMLAVATAAARGDRTVLVAASTSALSIGATGRLDLGGNDLIVHGGSVATVGKLAGTGYDGGKWDGPGLASAAAAADSAHHTALGVIQNVGTGTAALFSTFDGVAVSAADVLVKYTYYGDANLSGTVTAADYSRTDAGYVNNLTGWANGDFNYDGTVDGSDYTLIDAAFNGQSTAL